MVSSSEATVDIRGQTIVGRRTCQDEIEEFRGIPYGDVPARWQHSILRSRLPSDKFDAARNGPRCPQPAEPNNSEHFQSHLDFPDDVEESEFDCLNLFVVRPSGAKSASEAGELLPVFVWIHGGGYGFGASTDPMWNPTRLVQKSIEIGKPIIAVAINYRLNIFGFAASPSIIAAQSHGAALRGANFGLGDQRTALEWISNNITSFGGDPERITIGGQSAGGSSTHAHVIEAMQDSGPSLFRSATIQSGAVGTLGPIPLQVAAASFDSLSTHLGSLHKGEHASSLEHLKDVPASQLVAAAGELNMHVFPLVDDGLTIKPGTTSRFAVHLQRTGQGATETSDATRTRPMQVLIGDAEVEASIWHDQVSQFSSYAQIESMLQAHLAPSAVTATLNAYHIEKALPSEDLKAKISLLLTDIEFGLPVHLAHKEIVASGGSALPYHAQNGNPWPGPNYGIAHHCIELIYLFDCFPVDMKKADQTAIEAGERGHLTLVDAVQRFWLDFITLGNDEQSSAKDTVFAKDRSVANVSVVDEGRQQRLDVVREYHDQLRAVLRDILSGKIGE